MSTDSPTNRSTDSCQQEPRCLVPPESRWYRRGIGFTCQQIMFPLMLVAVLLLIMALVQLYGLISGTASDGSWLQFVLTATMLLLTARAIWFVRESLIQPLSQIRMWVSEVRGGKFSARMPAFKPGEFNDLATDINRLADLVQNLHEDLEGEVATQTERLARKTQSLELLYEVVTQVNEADEAEGVLRQLMQRLAEIYQTDAIVLRVLKESKLELLDSFGLATDSAFMAQSVPIRSVIKSHVFGEGQIGVRNQTVKEALSGHSGNARNMQVISIPLQYRDSIHGSYQLFVPPGFPFTSDCAELLGSIGQHLGVLMEQSRLDFETGKLMLVEERSRLANELHDSLAQTLASLRFQVRVLDETLHQGDEQVTWEELEKLEDQVEIANTELRSLIVQVRAPMQSQDIVISTRKLVNKFEQDSGVNVYLQNEWSEDSLSMENRIDVVRIVQEALANVRKHARASRVRVLIRNDVRGYRVVVEDDGQGYQEQQPEMDDSGEHIGQAIMMERADRLGATLHLESEPGEGSSVILEFDYESADRRPLAATA